MNIEIQCGLATPAELMEIKQRPPWRNDRHRYARRELVKLRADFWVLFLGSRHSSKLKTIS